MDHYIVIVLCKVSCITQNNSSLYRNYNNFYWEIQINPSCIIVNIRILCHAWNRTEHSIHFLGVCIKCCYSLLLKPIERLFLRESIQAWGASRLSGGASRKYKRLVTADWSNRVIMCINFDGLLAARATFPNFLATYKAKETFSRPLRC